MKILDRIMGKTQIADKKMSYQEVLDLMGCLEKDAVINVDYSCGGHWDVKSTPTGTVNFIEKEFKPSPHAYCEARYQAASCKGNEKHRIELEKGSIEGRVGVTELWGKPFQRSTLSFTLNNEE